MDNLDKTIELSDNEEDSVGTIFLTGSHPNFSSLPYETACTKLNESFYEFSLDSSLNSQNNQNKFKRTLSNFSSFDGSKLDNDFKKLRQEETSTPISNLFPRSSLTYSKCFSIDNFIDDSIDDNEFDIEIYVKCEIEMILDKISTKQQKFRIGNYYNLFKKEKTHSINVFRLKELEERLKYIEETRLSSTDLIWIEQQKRSTQRRLDEMIKITEASLEDLNNFKLFLNKID